jgi:hypothetical protein
MSIEHMFDVLERGGTHLDEGGDPIERIETAVAALAGEDRSTGPATLSPSRW